MQKEIRTFVALKICAGDKISLQAEHFKQVFKNDRIKWVEPENYHLTLRFIGNTTREQLYSLVDALENTAAKHHSFNLKIKGAGYFGSKRKPRVLLVNVSHSEELSALVQCVDRQVVSCGFNKELKPFRPHLTLGRIKHLNSRTRFYSIVDEYKFTEYQTASISEFILYQSILTTEGPIYKTIKIFKLK